MSEIGETLREARMRGHIDVSEIEAKTKIRAKYLRALENEEWGLLPGPTFVKSFLRTYAQALGLDGKALVEQYRATYERPSEVALEPIGASPQSSRTRPPGRPRAAVPASRAYLALVGVVLVVIVLLIVGLVSGGGGSSTPTANRSAARKAHGHAARGGHGSVARHAPKSPVMALSLRAIGRVYVCLLGEGGAVLLNGAELVPGDTTPTFHAKHFEVTLGNSSVEMILDGSTRTVPPSSEAIGYSITRTHGRRTLAPGKLPTCT